MVVDRRPARGHGAAGVGALFTTEMTMRDSGAAKSTDLSSPSGLELVAAMSIFALSSCGHATPGTGPSAPLESIRILSIDTTSLYFGRAWEQADFPLRLQIRNNQPRHIEVIRVESSCNCLSVEPRSFTVPGNGAISVRLHLDLRRPSWAAGSNWRFRSKLCAVVREPPCRQSWEVKGEVLAYPLRLEPPSLWIETFIGSSGAVRGTAEIRCDRSVSQVDARCPARFGSARVVPAGGRPEIYDVVITPDQHLPVGEHRFFVSLKPTLRTLPQGVGQPPELRVPVTVTVRRDVYASPSTIALGVLALGESASRRLVLRSFAKADFRVIDIRVQPDKSLAVKPCGAVQPGERRYFIQQRADRTGARSAEVRFLVEESQGKRATYWVTVPVSYYGTSASGPGSRPPTPSRRR